MVKALQMAIMAWLLSLSAAQAQTSIDVAKITCKQFTLLQVANPEVIAIWLSGYYHGKRGTTIVDVELLKDQASQVRTYCLYKDEGGTLMEAVGKVVSPGK